MAYEMQIRNSPGRAKIRSVWAVALLPIITLGIYLLVWWYKINRELRDYGDSKGYDLGQSPTNSLLALFPGGFIIIPPLVSYWRGTHRVQGAARLARTAVYRTTSGKNVTGVTSTARFGSGSSFGSPGQRYGSGSLRSRTVSPPSVRATVKGTPKIPGTGGFTAKPKSSFGSGSLRSRKTTSRKR